MPVEAPALRVSKVKRTRAFKLDLEDLANIREPGKSENQAFQVK
jgi:hypothetical protein